MAQNDIRTCWRQFLRQVHPDIFPPEFQKEKAVNTDFVKYLNEYIQSDTASTASRPNSTLRYYFKAADRIIPKTHTFVSNFNESEKMKCLNDLFRPQDLNNTNPKTTKATQAKMSLFGSLLQDHYKRKRK